MQKSKPGTACAFVFFAFVILCSTAQAQSELSVEQVEAALKIASSTISGNDNTTATEQDAAEQEATTERLKRLQRLSADAVSRALQFGPPTRSEADGADPLIFRSVVVDINREIPMSRVESFRSGLPGRLIGLSGRWQNRDMDPALAYEALKICVNPPARPDRLFLYPIENYRERYPAFSEAKSVAHELVDWAAQAQQLEQLQLSLAEQQFHSVAEGCFLFLLIAMEERNIVVVKQSCERLQRFVQRAIDPALARLLATTLMKADPALQKLPEISELLQHTAEALLAIDGQTAGQANFAATAAVAGLNARITQSLQTVDASREGKAMAAIGNRLLTRNSLPANLKSILRAAVADEFLMASISELAVDDPLKSAVLERRVRFNNERARSLVQTGQAQTEGSSIKPKPVPGILIDWAPGTSPNPNSIWCQIRSFDDESIVDSRTVLTIQGLIGIGSPSANVDGSVIAFHGRRPGSVPGSGNHVFVLNRINQTVTDIGPAVNPGLSPTGRRLTCSRYTPHKGIWLVRSDGSNWEQMAEDGWASKFSKDGTNIGWTFIRDGRTSIRVYDLVARSHRPEILRGASSMQTIGTSTSVTGWPFCWGDRDGPDGLNNYWWFDRANSQVLRYPVHHIMTPKYLSTKRIPIAHSIERDFHFLADARMVWLGPVEKSKGDLGMWKLGSDEPFSVPKRNATGLAVFGLDQILLFSGPAQ